MAKTLRKAPAADEMQQFKGQFGGAGGFNPSALVRKRGSQGVSGYAKGTSRVARRGSTDTVPAMMTPGEGVLNTGAMGMPGMGKFLRAANKKGIKRMQEGGTVDELTRQNFPSTRPELRESPLDRPARPAAPVGAPAPTPAATTPTAGARPTPGVIGNPTRYARNDMLYGYEEGGTVNDPRKLFGGSKGVQELAKGGTAHPGFKAVQSKIASRSGVGKERAGAILAAATRRASPAAKKANPRLKRVKG